MNIKNDEIILTLKKKVDEKKALIKKAAKFSPITNCSIELDGIRFNIQTLSKDLIILMLVRLNSYKMSAKELDLVDSLIISGYKVTDWIEDLQSRLVNINKKDEESKLRAMEIKLEALLSNEKKVELELDDIAKSLEGI